MILDENVFNLVEPVSNIRQDVRLRTLDIDL
jgi:hypothetical protein